MTVGTNEKGFIFDESRGLVVPERMLDFRPIPHPFDDPRRRRFAQSGTVLARDPETGVVITPGYGTGFDDLMMRAVVGGYIRNVGISQVIDPQLSTLVAKRQAMAGTWQILLSGKKTPTQKFLNVIAQAQDSSYGGSVFSQLLIGALDVDNRGAIFAQLPIETTAFDNWDSIGLEAIPVEPLEGGRTPTTMRKVEDRFFLRVSPEKFRENRGLWMIDGINCSPTGDPEWPYWIRKWSEDLGKHVWVLIHKDHGGQITQVVGPRNTETLGVGQSGTWRYLKILLQDVMIVEMDIEALFNQPPRGIIWGTALDFPSQLRDQLTQFKTDRHEDEVLYYPGVLIGGSKNDKAIIRIIRWVEPPAGYTPETWKKEKEDVLASCFHMSVAQIVTRLGEGAFTQSRVTDDIQAETGIAWMRSVLETVYNHLAPPRVMVTINWLSDRAKRYQTETFVMLTQGIKGIQDSTEGQGLSVDEIRDLMQLYGGIQIPNSDGIDGVVSISESGPGKSLGSIGSRVMAGGMPGVVCGFRDGRALVRHKVHLKLPGLMSAEYNPSSLMPHSLAIDPFLPQSSDIPDAPTSADRSGDDLSSVTDLWEGVFGDDWEGAISE